MKTPTMDDYVKLLCTLFAQFVQEHPEPHFALPVHSDLDHQRLALLRHHFSIQPASSMCTLSAARD